MDKLRIARGITRYSSGNWEVRLFLSDPGTSLARDLAPELCHAGLFLAFGSGQPLPVVLSRHLPLFGEVHPLPPDAGAGAMFLTTSRDELAHDELELLGECLFGLPSAERDARASPAAARCERLFRQVMSDAWHRAAPAAA